MEYSNKIKSLLLVVVLVFCVILVSSCAEQVEYSVTVKDSSGNPIENAVIAVSVDGSSEQTNLTTDSFGKAVYSASSGSQIKMTLTELPDGLKIPESNEVVLDSGKTSGEFIVPVKVDFSLTLKSEAGAPISDLRVEFYSDEELSDLESFGITDKDGRLVKQLLGGKEYYLSFPELPAGYVFEGSYTVSEGENTVSLSTEIVRDNMPNDHSYYIGDVMYDFTVETVDGETFKLSEILKDRRMVMFNFWYINCNFCIAEFAVFDEVYGEYSDKVGLIALNNYGDDTPLKVNKFVTEKREQKENGISGGIEFSFDVAKGGEDFRTAFASTLEDGQWDSWPVSVIVDRYGVICLAIDGDIKTAAELEAIFDHFTADDYTQKLYSSYDEFLAENN